MKTIVKLASLVLVVGSNAFAVTGAQIAAQLPTPEYQKATLNLHAPSPHTGYPNICQLVKQVNALRDYSSEKKEMAEELLELVYEGLDLRTPCPRQSPLNSDFVLIKPVGTMLPSEFWTAFSKQHSSSYLKGRLDSLNDYYYNEYEFAPCKKAEVFADVQACINKITSEYSILVSRYNSAGEEQQKVRDAKMGKAMLDVLAARKKARASDL